MPIGNDVVDLRDEEAHPGAVHRRFVERVCRPDEAAAIAAAADPNRLLWAYWAAKEAAFKALHKLCPELRFLPRRFAVGFHGASPAERLRGEVTVDGLRAEVEVESATNHLHAIAHAPFPGEGLRHAEVHTVRRIARATTTSGGLRAAARAELAALVARQVGCAPSAVRVASSRRRGEPPLVTVAGHDVALDVSLSHHGTLVACACSSRQVPHER